MTKQPVTPAIDNLVLEVDGGAGSIEETWSPAPTVGCC